MGDFGPRGPLGRGPEAPAKGTSVGRDCSRLAGEDLRKLIMWDLFIFGSANLSSALTRKGLIDEYRLCVAPIVLGGGNPLFKESSELLKLKLIEARPLKSSGVILRYEPRPP